VLVGVTAHGSGVADVVGDGVGVELGLGDVVGHGSSGAGRGEPGGLPDAEGCSLGAGGEEPGLLGDGSGADEDGAGGVGFGEIDQDGVGLGVVGAGAGVPVGLGVGLGLALGAFTALTTRVAAKNSHHQIREILTLSPAVGACTILLLPI